MGQGFSQVEGCKPATYGELLQMYQKRQFRKAMRKRGVEVGQAPPPNAEGKMVTERGHPGLTLLVHTLCTLSNSPASLHTVSDGALPLAKQLIPLLASLSPLVLSLPLGATQKKTVPSDCREPCRDFDVVTLPFWGSLPKL